MYRGALISILLPFVVCSPHVVCAVKRFIKIGENCEVKQSTECENSEVGKN